MIIADCIAELRALAAKLLSEGRYNPKADTLLDPRSRNSPTGPGFAFGGSSMIGQILIKARRDGAFNAPHLATIRTLIGVNDDQAHFVVKSVGEELAAHGFDCYAPSPIERLADVLAGLATPPKAGTWVVTDDAALIPHDAAVAIFRLRTGTNEYKFMAKIRRNFPSVGQKFGNVYKYVPADITAIDVALNSAGRQTGTDPTPEQIAAAKLAIRSNNGHVPTQAANGR